MSRFSRRIAPSVQLELQAARQAESNHDTVLAFQHLENAHVLGQQSTLYHTWVHLRMLQWGLRYQLSSVPGQVFRVIGALTKTAIGLVPQGNTGGSQINPFKKLPLKPEHAILIAAAQCKSR